MLKITIHSGMLKERKITNQLAVIDIAYEKRAPLADYLVALSLRVKGELAPARVKKYPRWSGSFWDLVARALAQLLYRVDNIPPSGSPDRRCAYATRICAVIERVTTTTRGVELGTAEILQRGGKRGTYTAVFDENVAGSRTVDFEFSYKELNHAELLLRAIC